MKNISQVSGNEIIYDCIYYCEERKIIWITEKISINFSLNIYEEFMKRFFSKKMRDFDNYMYALVYICRFLIFSWAFLVKRVPSNS